MTGKVKFINEEKGFGFITSRESKKDIFVHSSALIDEIWEDDLVEFDVEESERGPSAKNVRVLQSAGE